ncbi:SRPBCC family protein [Nocardioides sp. Kera G14]|uniref:SRPBCC family protein n=1 Tax=Nocardioides sp. Kera G14 TaxID=2884264 RepID=UPI001D126A7E|nr:SRPBCC family protein [Nocardioides sp. Kera G14]UDY24649.1 SRPBCC family protein [Nocardioides sp. Kera G14]
MSTVRVHVTHSFTSSPQEVFDALSEHENLGPLFGANITRLRDGETSRNGVGSARTLRIVPLLPGFVETTTVSEPPHLIEYRITGGLAPIKDHHGVQRLMPRPDGGTDLDYAIAFDSAVPGLAPVVGKVLTRTLTKALPNLVP